MSDPANITEFGSDHTRRRSAAVLIVVLGTCLGVLGTAGGLWLRHRMQLAHSTTAEPTEQPGGESPFAFAPQDGRTATTKPPRTNRHGSLTLQWESLSNQGAQPVSTASSNIHPEDYVGAEACQKCHKKNYESWSRHPHRFMNARATAETVKGDFAGDATIQYQGASGRFFVENGEYRMEIRQDGKTHLYGIAKTLGSRFFQYYIGHGIGGEAPRGHDYYEEDQVLPFGYWIDRRMWVPIVHVADELPDENGRWNPLTPPFQDKNGQADLVYAERCSMCHTTYPLGDSMIRHPEFRGNNLPYSLRLGVSQFTAQSHPEFWDGANDAATASNSQMLAVVDRYAGLQEPDKAPSLGISCEACHLGSREHAEGKLKRPSFSPHSPALAYDSTQGPPAGAAHANVNWACSRCHAGHRPQYACGVATWNSTEYSDAVKGSCYSQLKCIDCHNPHQATGSVWSKPPEADDAVCLKCHDQFQAAQQRLAHTHHPAGSSGDRCFNCHMPKINEGLQDAVRTHMIYSPTRSDMLEAGQPNACNLCHLDRPVQWTLDTLKSWYNAECDPKKLAVAYPDPAKPAGLYWLNHHHEGTRLVAVDALGKQKAHWALPAMIEILDDEYLLNRQFAQRAIEEMLDVKLDQWGYVFYMTKAERQEPLAALRRELGNAKPTGATE
ncbi:MAG: hypothetical protein KDB14_14275 [Planctomycetales bacterium]|nr:hypothetical protein [Planctomycetales bacterium]